MKYTNPPTKKKFNEIKLNHQTNEFKLVGVIILNSKKMASLGYYEYFKDSSNFFDLSTDEGYENFIRILDLGTQEKTEVPIKKEKIVKTSDEIVNKYLLYDFKSEIENFNHMSPLKQGELLYNIKKRNSENFVSFYEDLGIDKSYVSLRIKLYDLSIEFIDFIDVIENLKVGIIGCFPKNNYSLKETIFQKIRSGELKQDRNEIKNFINQAKFTDKEKIFDTKLIKLRLFLDKRKYSKLSDTSQQYILNQLNKIENAIKGEGNLW